MDANNLSTRIRRSRMSSGLQGKDLAARLGISRPYLTQIEKGQRIPSEELLIRLAETLNVSTHWLTHGDHPTHPRLVPEGVVASAPPREEPSPSACPQCAAKDKEIVWLKKQIEGLIAALAEKPSPTADPACGAEGRGSKERKDA